MVLSVTALHFFMHVHLDFLLENTRPRRLVQICDLENVCGIDPVVFTPPHDMGSADIEFIHGDLKQR